ncbi:hypothetical protein IGB42_03374 [Andreprevotia sp. IGB-42]|uniref:hypothetical protein n=1 Tax=Andreprevotia sp. IGB-42 TaxID=2497473 RepID=UPI001357C203|nr:hypothetical protein [Andreprevotia sp. IGB-42]KAF0812097.1 hypothetical protein IGB42_03374 [Andreprevotia sp. IGB-42]
MPRIDPMPRIKRCLLLSSVLLLAACASIGPTTLVDDRLRYTLSAAQSLEEQLLLNIVRARHAEAPSFVEVSQIVGSYELTREVSVGGEIHPQDTAGFMSLGSSARLADRPTVTYSPLGGEHFARAVMAPVPIDAVLSLIQSGWAADAVLEMLVRSVNGIQNRLPRLDHPLAADPRYAELKTLMRQLQDEGAIEFRIHKRGQQAQSLFIMLRKPATAAAASHLATLHQLLDLPSDMQELPITAGLLAGQRGEVAIYTYSLMQVLISQSEQIDLPPAHVAGKLVPMRAPGEVPERMHIHSGETQPADAAVSVRYRSHWYWIAADDRRSKTIMMAMAVIYRLLESGNQGNAPLLTLPAN